MSYEIDTRRVRRAAERARRRGRAVRFDDWLFDRVLTARVLARVLVVLFIAWLLLLVVPR